MKKLSIITLAVFVSGFACSQDTQKMSATEVVSAYMVLKDALVDSDGAAASTAATNLNKAIGSSSDKLMKSILAKSKKIAASKDVKAQRVAFTTMSDFVYELAKSTDASEMTLYKQHCPMANGNKGANWLSTTEEIRNPYFGNMMLSCGSTQETIN